MMIRVRTSTPDSSRHANMRSSLQSNDIWLEKTPDLNFAMIKTGANPVSQNSSECFAKTPELDRIQLLSAIEGQNLSKTISGDRHTHTHTHTE